jgi:phosphatidate phosphatase APP1
MKKLLLLLLVMNACGSTSETLQLKVNGRRIPTRPLFLRMQFLQIIKGSGRNKPVQNVCRNITSVNPEQPFVNRTMSDSE